jgi:trigger factor
MMLTHEKKDSLNMIVRAKIGPDDYNERVQKSLKDYQRKVQMPGFRAGKVPASLVKKMYGKSILVDEINKILNDRIYRYLTDQKIEILGQPLPVREENEIDWDHQQDFEFSYEVGLSPEFQIDLDALGVQEEKVVKIDEEMIEREVNDMRRRYGKVSYPEQIEAGDMVYADFTELTESGDILEGGISKNAPVFLSNITDQEVSTAFVGLAKNASIEIDPAKVWPEPAIRARNLGVENKNLDALSTRFKVSVTNITRVTPADLNEELFTKIYGDQVSNEEDFRNRIRQELGKMFQRETQQRFINTVMENIGAQANMAFPEDFLKRWLMVANEKPLTVEQLEAEFGDFLSRLRRQLIMNKLVKQFGISVSEDEASSHVRTVISEQFLNHNGYEIEEEELSATVGRILANQKEYEKLMEFLYDQKLSNLLSEKVKKQTIELSLTEFYSSPK